MTLLLPWAVLSLTFAAIEARVLFMRQEIGGLPPVWTGMAISSASVFFAMLLPVVLMPWPTLPKFAVGLAAGLVTGPHIGLVMFTAASFFRAPTITNFCGFLLSVFVLVAGGLMLIASSAPAAPIG